MKIEGGNPEMAETVRALVRTGIPVMGHLGFTPQSVRTLGGFKVQGREALQAEEILEDAAAVQEAGAFAVVAEGVPADLGARVTERLAVPVIGIGAGPHCDGQVLVWHDVLGLGEGPSPRFVRRYEDLAARIEGAVRRFADDVRSGSFPSVAESYGAPAPAARQD